MSDERRSRERVHVGESVKVIDMMRDKELGKLVNLHQEGFMLISSERIEEGSLYQLRFTPLPPADTLPEVIVGAECLWVSKTDSGDQIWAGFHIMDLAEADLQRIEFLTKRFSLNG